MCIRDSVCPVVARVMRNGHVLDEKRFTTGFKTVELVQVPQPSGARSFRFRVNGTDIRVTGLNWTPLDAIFARISPEKVTDTLERLARMGCNMVRVWGGGIYEDQHFYNECDRLGILVWQDFMMACGWYPQTDEFAVAIEEEVRQIVHDLRNHPCIALWAGDNECDVFYPALAGQNRLTREIIARVCRELHPEVPYLPSSPYSPSGRDPQDDREGDVHDYAHGENYRESRLWTRRCRFMSEFGHLSLPSLQVIRRYWPPGTEWPLTNAMWRYHAADTTRVARFRGADCILRSLAACGRPLPENVEQAVTASQELQAEAIVELIRHWCEDQEFGGFLLWNVADCWPQQSDSVMDYLGNPKRVCEFLPSVFREVRERYRPA
ncbi:MAG: hypothetical protein N2255_10910, partial [Kiritimatiellae bacterium]|nr:hypothetical protein [Kiritimatiellia bacterium]